MVFRSTLVKINWKAKETQEILFNFLLFLLLCVCKNDQLPIENNILPENWCISGYMQQDSTDN